MNHIPVLLKEVMDGLDPKPGETMIDGTANGGGHTRAIADRVAPDGKVISIEWDKEIFKKLKSDIENSEYRDRVVAVNDNYANLKNILSGLEVEKADGVLLDLGFSSVHVDISGRGFSFQKDEPLDMRYNQDQAVTAYEIVNSWPELEIAEILKKYGEERFAYRIAKSICENRKREKIGTTLQLVDVVRGAVPAFYRKGKINCATRTFQALRIAVNGELDNIENVLPQMIDVLSSGGRIAIISFHSLEDRIIKNFFRDKSKEGLLKTITKKPITAAKEEAFENPRARSAKLRVAVKI